MVKNEETVTKGFPANEIYALCRIYQLRQEKGRELTEEELIDINSKIKHELSVYETTIIAE